MKNELQQNRKGNRIFPIFRRVKASIYREFHEEKELNQPLFLFSIYTISNISGKDEAVFLPIETFTISFICFL